MHKRMHITYTGVVQGAMDVDRALDHDSLTREQGALTHNTKAPCSLFSAKYMQGLCCLHI